MVPELFTTPLPVPPLKFMYIGASTALAISDPFMVQVAAFTPELFIIVKVAPESMVMEEIL